MKHLLVHNIRPGMKIGKDVYGSNNLLLIPKNTIVTNPIITNLLSHEVISVFIDDSVTPNNEDLKNVRSVNQEYNVKEMEQFKTFEKNHTKAVNNVQEAFQKILKDDEPIEPEKLLQDLTNLFPSNMTNLGLFDMLHHMREYDDTTYIHSVNVALICNVFGRWLQLSPEDLKVLTLCGLFHDIGKLMIPDSIIKKPDKLTNTEYDIVKQHPFYGFQILSKQKLDPRITQAALLHHERCDGYGYPLGFDRSKINDFALIVAIADVYDAMTSARVYRAPVCPFTVIKYLEAESMQRFDPHYFMTFNEQILSTYINADVKLSNGQNARVVYINRHDLTHPIVKIGKKCIDLSVKKDIDIVSII